MWTELINNNSRLRCDNCNDPLRVDTVKEEKQGVEISLTCKCGKPKLNDKLRRLLII